MEQILTQKEVDDLLTGLEEGEIKVEKDIGQKKEDISRIELYDFRSQEKTIGSRMPTFEVLNERFSRAVRNSLVRFLSTGLDLNNEPLRTLKFKEFVKELQAPTSLHVFRMTPFHGHGLVVLENDIIYHFINFYFGGFNSKFIKIEGREYTLIESLMINNVVKIILKHLETTWSHIHPDVNVSYVRSETNPQFSTIVSPEDLVIVTNFDVEIMGSSAYMMVCIPYMMVEGVRNKLALGFREDVKYVTKEWTHRFEASILESYLNLNVSLGSTQITGEDLLDMRVGDVIMLDKDIEENLLGYVEDIPKFSGTPGVQRGFQAFKVANKVENAFEK